MNPKIRRLLALAVAAPLAMGACGPDEETEDMEIDAPVTEAPSTTSPSAPMSVQLDAVGNSGIEGEASTMHRGEEMEVTVALAGLTGEGDYTATIEPGSCPMSSPGDPATPRTGEGDATGGANMGDAGMGDADMGDADMGDRSAGGMAGGDDMGQEIAEIDLQVSGNSATGSATFSASEISGGAHIAVRDASDQLVACGDVRGGGMGAGGTGQGAGGTGQGTGGQY